MRTDTPRPSPTRAADVAIGTVAGSLGIFGLLRLPWTEAHLVLPAVAAQGAMAVRVFGASPLPVTATLACSGADLVALCTGAILAFPVAWPRRLSGAAAGIGLILLLNTIRIGTLGRVVASPVWFSALHLYVWPAVLTLAIAGYVFAWMRAAEPRELANTGIPHPSRRFVLLTVAFVSVFTVASPLYLESAIVLAIAGFIARTAALVLGLVGVSAHTSANALWTAGGGYAVTQECIATPLIPVYLAAVCAYARTPRRLVAGVLATLPLFVTLGVARLLVVALPSAEPLFFVHAFYQLLLALVAVLAAALWRHGRRGAPLHALAGVTSGVLFLVLLGRAYTRGIMPAASSALADPQGALAFLPSFQIALFLALAVTAFTAIGWRRLLAGVAALGATHVAGLVALTALAAFPAVSGHVPAIRAWAVAGPVLVFAAMVSIAPARR